MSESHRVEIEVLGQRYVIRSQAPPEHVQRLVDFLEGRVREIRGDGPAQDPMKLLTMAALDIADELIRIQDDRDRQDGDATARVRALVYLLDSVVESR
ncbi:MAG TPA: cell division protein ZapA [Candidatus Binatia bacterium]|nr:cell division protein ZapA [Candidatus Binatia bacterium]